MTKSDIGFALFVMLAHVRAIVDDEPSAQHEESAGEGNEMGRIEKIEHAAAQREHRKGADAAGPSLVGVRKKIFESQAEKEAQAKQQRNARRGRCRDHGAAIMEPAFDPLKSATPSVFALFGLARSWPHCVDALSGRRAEPRPVPQASPV